MTYNISIQYGKSIINFEFDETNKEWFMQLQSYIQEHWGILSEHQKLVYRGKNLTSESIQILKPKSKVMLLLNQIHYNNTTTCISEKITTTLLDNEEKVETNSSLESSRLKTPMYIQDLDQEDDIPEGHILLHLFRGKQSKYNLLFQLENSILDVKTRMGSILNIPSAGIKLVIAGKSPQDSEQLKTVAEKIKTKRHERRMKCLLLFQEQVYTQIEKEQELAELLNDITKIQLEINKLKRRIQHNMLPKDERIVLVTTLNDRIHLIKSNLNLLLDFLRSSHEGIYSAIKECDEMIQTIDYLSSSV